MRVVAGTAKGRQLKGPKIAGTRPVMDRVKTALFDILAPHIRDSRFLDLFAGTGSVGIEALSRGAAAATFVEMSAEMLKLVRENLTITRLSAGAETVRSDAFAFLASAARSGRRYDIVYVAPPQYEGMAARAVVQLDASPLTEPEGLVIAQVHPRERGDFDSLTLQHLRLVDERRYGSTLLIFFEHTDDGQDAADKPDTAAEAQEPHSHDEFDE